MGWWLPWAHSGSSLGRSSASCPSDGDGAEAWLGAGAWRWVVGAAGVPAPLGCSLCALLWVMGACTEHGLCAKGPGQPLGAAGTWAWRSVSEGCCEALKHPRYMSIPRVASRQSAGTSQRQKIHKKLAARFGGCSRHVPEDDGPPVLCLDGIFGVVFSSLLYLKAGRV